MPVYVAHSKNQKGSIQTYSDHANGFFHRYSETVNSKKCFVQEQIQYLTNIGKIVSFVHDMGKLEPYSQEVLHGIRNAKMPNHVVAGLLFLINNKKQMDFGSFLFSFLTIAGHHKGLPDRKNDLQQMLDASPVSVRNPELNYSGVVLKWVSEQYVQIEKALDSIWPKEERVFPNQRNKSFETPLTVRMISSFFTIADHGDTAAHFGNFYPSKNIKLKGIERAKAIDDYTLELNKKSNKRNYERSLLYKDVSSKKLSGFNFITAPTGCGKTVVVSKKTMDEDPERFIYSAPYITIINQSSNVIRSFF